MAQQMADAEWLKVQDDINNFIAEFRDEHEVKAETDEYILFADEHGHELSEIAELNGVDRGELSARMHAEARERYGSDGAGDPWSASDPILVYKHV